MQFPYTYGRDVSDVYPNVTMTIEEIYPIIAAKMLKTNIRNRGMKNEPLKKAIEDNEWMLNGSTIVFSDDGVLLDGQNRLKACVDSGKPIVVIVVRGIPEHAQQTMDVGAKRNLRDWAKMNGYPNVVTNCAVSVQLQRGDMYGLEGALVSSNGYEMTLVSQIRFFQDNFDTRIRPLALRAKPLAEKYKHTGVGMWAVLIEAFQNSLSEDDVNLFLGQLLGLAVPCQSVLTLKNKLEANSTSKTGWFPMKTVAAFVIKTLNAYMRGEDVKCLRFVQGGAHPESFPAVYSYERED